MVPRPLIVAVVLATALAASPSTARAETETEWYGYKIIGTDLGGAALLIVGAKGESLPVAAIGIATLAFGGPIVHVTHGNYGRAGASFGLRTGGVLIGAVIGAGLTSKSDDTYGFSALAGMAAGGLIGFLTASIIDIAVIAREEKDLAATPRMFSLGGRF